MNRARIIGSYVSPYVRKVLVVLDLKRVPYEIDPIVPFLGDERFSRLSPLRRIPVFVDDRVSLADSSVICQYLEDRYPEPPLYPADIADRARARWPETAAFVERVLAQDCFRKLNAYEERCMRVPPARQRGALAEMGAPVTSESYGTDTPRRGVMKID